MKHYLLTIVKDFEAPNKREAIKIAHDIGAVNNTGIELLCEDNNYGTGRTICTECGQFDTIELEIGTGNVCTNTKCPNNN